MKMKKSCWLIGDDETRHTVKPVNPVKKLLSLLGGPTAVIINCRMTLAASPSMPAPLRPYVGFLQFHSFCPIFPSFFHILQRPCFAALCATCYPSAICASNPLPETNPIPKRRFFRTFERKSLNFPYFPNPLNSLFEAFILSFCPKRPQKNGKPTQLKTMFMPNKTNHLASVL